MIFPETLPVATLLQTNECYEPGRIMLHEALYYGGKQFDRIKSKVLWSRQMDSGDKPGARAARKARMQAATYTPHITSFMDVLSACLFQSSPCLIFSGPEEKLAYYNGLNEDLASLLYDVTIQMMLHGNGYISKCYPDTDDEYADLDQQKTAGALDATLCGIQFSSVTDQEMDDDGDILWLKTYSCDLEREHPWEQPSMEVHTWTYFCPDAMYEYQASKPILDSNGQPVEWDKDAKATMTKNIEVEGNPIIKVALPTGFCLMDAAAPLALALFNREASVDFALNMSAFCMLVVKSDLPLTEIIANEMSCLRVHPGDAVEWAAPQGIVFDALRTNVEDKRKALENSIHSAALNIASRDQGGRASGVAKFRDFGPIAILLQTYGDVLRAALEEAVEDLIETRGDTGAVTFEVLGLDEFDLESLDSKLDLVTRFLALPGPESAKRWAVGDLAQSMSAGAPVEVREAIKTEAERMPAMADQRNPLLDRLAQREGLVEPADKQSQDNHSNDSQQVS